MRLERKRKVLTREKEKGRCKKVRRGEAGKKERSSVARNGEKETQEGKK